MANIAAAAAALVGAVVGAVGLYLSRKGVQRTESAEQMAQIFDAHHQVVVDLTKEVRRVNIDRAALRAEVETLTAQMLQLRGVLAGQIAASAAMTSMDEGDDEDEEVRRIQEFIRSMKEI